MIYALKELKRDIKYINSQLAILSIIYSSITKPDDCYSITNQINELLRIKLNILRQIIHTTKDQERNKKKVP